MTQCVDCLNSDICKFEGTQVSESCSHFVHKDLNIQISLPLPLGNPVFCVQRMIFDPVDTTLQTVPYFEEKYGIVKKPFELDMLSDYGKTVFSSYTEAYNQLLTIESSLK